VTNPTASTIIAKSKIVSKKARKSALEMTNRSKASHIGSCLSVIDLLAVAFSQKTLDEFSSNNEILLSKGHAAAGLYAVLDAFHLLKHPLESYCEDESQLYGHVNHHASSQIPLSTGSLALSNKKLGNKQKTIVVISDGELNEGTTWESALVAPQHELSEMILIIDRNRIQSLGFTEETLRLDPIASKWESFGWDVIEIDGHNHFEILHAISSKNTKPLCVIANTVKGKGVTFMENSIEWHYKAPSTEEMNLAFSEIDEAEK